MNIKEVREKFPQYEDLSDIQLADALHQKFYSDLPRSDFFAQVGVPINRAGAVERGVRGVAKGLMDPVDAANQLVTRMTGAKDSAAWWDRDIQKREADYQRDVRGGQDDFDFGRLAGNLVGTAPLTAAMPVPATALRAAGLGAAGGAALGGLSPVTQGDFLTEKMRQVTGGAASGAVAGPLTYGLSRVISPKVSPEAAMLKREGVTPTPGQALGGAFKSAEEKMTSLPILGYAIRKGQARANEQFNAAAVNRALYPIGQRLPKGMSGNEAIDHAGKALGKSYDDVLDAVGPVQIDAKMADTLQSIYAKTATMPKEKAEQFARIVQNEIMDRAQNGRLTPEAMKAAESNLGNLWRGYSRNPDYDVQMLGEAIESAQDALRDMVQRQAPKGAAEALKATNAGWAAFKRVQRAAASTAAEDGVFNPTQLHMAVKALDPSKDKSRFARGDALMQDLSGAGKKALANKTPDSGTAGRQLAAGMVGGVGLGVAPVETLTAGAALSIPSLLYTPLGQQAASWALTGRQGLLAQGAADAVRRLGAPTGFALSPAFQQLIAQ